MCSPILECRTIYVLIRIEYAIHAEIYIMMKIFKGCYRKKASESIISCKTLVLKTSYQINLILLSIYLSIILYIFIYHITHSCVPI